MARQFKKICELGQSRRKLALDEAGGLWRYDSGWQPVDFNGLYSGYYTSCRFTALCATDKDFVAAGISEDGMPAAYRSLLGGVWDKISLMAVSPVNGCIQVFGCPVALLWDNDTRQLFMLCDNGTLVTIPDCPKCIRICHMTDQAVTDAKLTEGYIQAELADQSQIRLPVQEAAQFRVSFSYARLCLNRDGGWLADLSIGKTEQDDTVDRICSSNQYIHLEIEAVGDWLKSLSRDQFVAFICDFGVQADEAAAYARAHGFSKAVSLGGWRPLMHTQ